jgi:DUF4097 and DUF4098 domain-containing protein YvlB
MNLLPCRIAALRIGMACAVLAAVVALAPRAQAEEWVKTYSVTGRPQVRVFTDDGSVRISTGDTKQVEIRVEYHGYDLNKNLHLDSHQDADRIEVSVRTTSHWGFSWGNNSRRLRVEIRMPKDADLQVETGDGSVEAQSVNGNVDIHTGDGHIALEGAKGAIRLRTGDGHIEGRGLDGKVDANTGDGHVKLEGRFDTLEIKTGDGSIDARALSGSRMAASWNIRTGDGSVDLVLPPDFQANIDASTNDGRISLGIPVTVEGTFSKSQIHGKMNGGGQPLTIRTGDGSIRLNHS